MEVVSLCTITFTNLTITFRCPRDDPNCCPVKKHKELWETWYFWFGVGLMFLFVITSVTSYLASTCKRKQQNLIRIRNIPHLPGSAPVITTISGPGGIIQPNIKHCHNQVSPVDIGNTHVNLVEDFASPLNPPYPAVEPITIVRGSAPPQGFRQTNSYTEIVLPPGYVDSDHYKP